MLLMAVAMVACESLRVVALQPVVEPFPPLNGGQSPAAQMLGLVGFRCTE